VNERLLLNSKAQAPVFNVEQIEGLPDVHYTRSEPKDSSLEHIAHVDRLFASTGAMIRYGGTPACDHHAGYIASWLEVLKREKPAIFSAGAHALPTSRYQRDHINNSCAYSGINILMLWGAGRASRHRRETANTGRAPTTLFEPAPRRRNAPWRPTRMRRTYA
jgi:antirestriction protein ArdC